MSEITPAEEALNASIIKDHKAWDLPGEPKLYKRDKPDYCYESGCPLATKAHGFALGCGDPTTARFAVILEAIGKDEGPFRLVAPSKPRGVYDTVRECAAEIIIRQRDYAQIPLEFIRRGVPVVGKAGALLVQWLFAPLGIKRSELFIDNTLRCLPPRSGKTGKGAPYPTGDERKQAEQCCRHYDRFHLFKPDTLVFGIGPASLTREVTPLTLCLKDVEKARDFAAQGRRVLFLLGGKAVKAFSGFGENVTRWRGNFVPLAANWIEFYKTLFENTASRKIGKVGKVLDDLDLALGGSQEIDVTKLLRRKRTRKKKVKDESSIAGEKTTL